MEKDILLLIITQGELKALRKAKPYLKSEYFYAEEKELINKLRIITNKLLS